MSYLSGITTRHRHARRPEITWMTLICGTLHVVGTLVPRYKIEPPATASTAPGCGRPEGVDMGNPNAFKPWGMDANRPAQPAPSQCKLRPCDQPNFLELQVCRKHALEIAAYINEIVRDIQRGWITPTDDDWPVPEPLIKGVPAPHPPSYVYYLMLGPTTVKIGTTYRLAERIRSLRTDLQYVVAIERGGRDVEKIRHKQFAAERKGKREDFRLSDALKAHIGAMAPNRDELVRIATNRPLPDEIAG